MFDFSMETYVFLKKTTKNSSQTQKIIHWKNSKKFKNAS